MGWHGGPRPLPAFNYTSPEARNYVDETYGEKFPDIPPKMIAVVHHAIASVVYHGEYLKSLKPIDHVSVIFGRWLFRR
eukprot:766629-Hanusia_phi.AAC.1